MSITVKKLFSAILVISLLVSVAASAMNVSADTGENVPIVYVVGQGATLVSDKNDTGSEQIFPLPAVDKQYILDTIETLNPVFLRAYITGDYDEYCDVIYNAVSPLFEKIRLDESGNVKDNSGVKWKWSESQLKQKASWCNGTYGLHDFIFYYDWRLDVFEIAESLNSYIDAVLEATGASKVNIVSRCLGSNIVVAYLQSKGCDKVNKCVMYCDVVEGATMCSQPFSGQVSLDPDSIERYAYDLWGDNDPLYNLIKASLTLANKTYALDLVLDFAESVYAKVASDIVPRLICTTYGYNPSYWSMVTYSDKDTAKKFIFGNETEKYSELITKIDKYSNLIQKDIDELLLDFDKKIDIAIICKYGLQNVPIVSNYDVLSDAVTETYLSSHGATTSAVDGVLSDDYIAAAKELGTFDDYISCDLQVDASTCLFPEKTWFIKGISHKVFPGSIDEMIKEFLQYDGSMDVNTDAKYPRFLAYNDEDASIVPLTEENQHTDSWFSGSLLEAITNFINALVPIIKQLIQNSKN